MTAPPLWLQLSGQKSTAGATNEGAPPRSIILARLREVETPANLNPPSVNPPPSRGARREPDPSPSRIRHAQYHGPGTQGHIIVGVLRRLVADAEWTDGDKIQEGLANRADKRAQGRDHGHVSDPGRLGPKKRPEGGHPQPAAAPLL